MYILFILLFVNNTNFQHENVKQIHNIVNISLCMNK